MPSSIYRWSGFWLAAVLIALIGLIGCNNKNDDKSGDVKNRTQIKEKTDNNGKTIPGQLVSSPKERVSLFKNSVILDPPTDDQMRPPDTTCNGKNVGKIYESIANDLWDKVSFTNVLGKQLNYHAVMATELGEIHLDLFGDIAPNHVRNFVCLARAGYFDGMTFYYSQNIKVEEGVSAYIESGSPKGVSESGSGSIGYWLRRELSDKVTHEEGTVGACLDDCLADDPCTAACRFYITAAKAPQMNGLFTIFGKVTKGLDVVRTINTREVFQDKKDDDQKDDGSKQNHLKQPVLIRSVTIHTSLADS